MARFFVAYALTALLLAGGVAAPVGALLVHDAAVIAHAINR